VIYFIYLLYCLYTRQVIHNSEELQVWTSHESLQENTTMIMSLCCVKVANDILL